MPFWRGASRWAALCLPGAAYSRLGSQDGLGATPPPSRLVISRDPNLRSTPTSLDSSRLLNCLDRAMQALHDSDSSLEAWRKVVRPGEVVGLKVNCLAGRGNSTRPELVDAICERLQQAGIKEIVIWDRLNSDLESARFKIVERGSGIRCFGNDTLGFEDELATFGSVGSLVSKTLTQVCDAVINLPCAQGPRHRRRDYCAQEHVWRHPQPEQIPHERRQSLRGRRFHAAPHSSTRSASTSATPPQHNTRAGPLSCLTGPGRTMA